MLERTVGDCAEHQNRISAFTEYDSCLYFNLTTLFYINNSTLHFLWFIRSFVMQPCVYSEVFFFFIIESNIFTIIKLIILNNTNETLMELLTARVITNHI